MAQLKQRLMVDYYLGGLLHVLLKPIVVLLGRILHRDHRLEGCDDVTFLKLLGGGSLVVAYPSLLALKQTGKIKSLRLVASGSTKPFAESLGIFDEIILIRDQKLSTLVLDSISAIRRLFHCSVIVDLEIHSRLTTVFCLLTCARNRIGFYTVNSFWRQQIATHLLFCNQATGVFWLYDQIANLLGAQVPPFQEASRAFREHVANAAPPPPPRDGPARIGVAPCCSELGRERMLRIDEWVGILREKFVSLKETPSIELLGGKSDHAHLESLRAALVQGLPGAAVNNRAGELTLSESIAFVGTLRELLAIDSALLHFARLLGVNTTSYWGPTNPATRLRPTDFALDVVHYRQLPCSPCVHITAVAPCKGNNICMRFAANAQADENPNPCWLA